MRVEIIKTLQNVKKFVVMVLLLGMKTVMMDLMIQKDVRMGVWGVQERDGYVEEGLKRSKHYACLSVVMGSQLKKTNVMMVILMMDRDVRMIAKVL